MLNTKKLNAPKISYQQILSGHSLQFELPDKIKKYCPK